MRFILLINAAILSVAVTGCGIVPLHWHNVEALQKMGNEASVTDVDKAFGRTTVLGARTVEVAGRTYLLRLYDLAAPPVSAPHIPFAVIFTHDRKVLTLGKLEDLEKSTEPEVIALLPQLRNVYSQYQLFRHNPGMRPAQTGPFDCGYVCR